MCIVGILRENYLFCTVDNFYIWPTFWSLYRVYYCIIELIQMHYESQYKKLSLNSKTIIMYPAFKRVRIWRLLDEHVPEADTILDMLPVSFWELIKLNLNLRTCLSSKWLYIVFCCMFKQLSRIPWGYARLPSIHIHQWLVGLHQNEPIQEQLHSSRVYNHGFNVQHEYRVSGVETIQFCSVDIIVSCVLQLLHVNIIDIALSFHPKAIVFFHSEMFRHH